MKENSIPLIKVIIPAFNEEDSIGKVIKDIPSEVAEVIVVNNGSTDQTAAVAETAGATVLYEPQKGYGYACLCGMDYLIQNHIAPDILVFLDGDYSDHPEELPFLLAPIQNNKVDLVVGSRVPHKREKGSMTPQQVFGNGLACVLMKWLYGARFTDLGPFRAIRWEALMALEMGDKTYGWTIEMQLKVLKMKMKYEEVEVSYRKRIGVSKVSGTVKGTIFAGIKIVSWIFKHYFS